MNSKCKGAALLLSMMMLAGCTQPKGPSTAESAGVSVTATVESAVAQQGYTFTDAIGNTVVLRSWDRVVSLYGSFAETWTLAGGTLVGATEDAVSERQLELGPDVSIVGAVKEPNLEEILAAAPDFVILSADVSAQVDFDAALTEAQIPHAYYRVDTFAEYLAMLEQFCTLTGRQDLYEQNGLAVQTEIDAVLQTVQQAQENPPSVLLLRAYSTGCKAKGADNLAGVILQELGADNLVERHESLLEDLSIEEIVAADPDYIFVTTMGTSQEKALAWIEENLASNPAWAGLKAVQNDHYTVLPKELFHYKPNTRWGESYRYLAALLYPELADQL